MLRDLLFFLFPLKKGPEITKYSVMFARLGMRYDNKLGEGAEFGSVVVVPGRAYKVGLGSYKIAVSKYAFNTFLLKLDYKHSGGSAYLEQVYINSILEYSFSTFPCKNEKQGKALSPRSSNKWASV